MEELDELMAKILKDEIRRGICIKIIDDVGGDTEKEAAENYAKILEKLANANLKVSPSKTKIFPESADVLGWIWKKGGFIEPSPHRKNALVNTKEEDIKKTKDMRSFLGLYKTLHMATPNISALLSPLEEAVAGKESGEIFTWTHDLAQRFREAKNNIKNIHTLSTQSTGSTDD